MVKHAYEWQKMKNKHMKCALRIQYLGGFANDFDDKEKWHRDFEVPGTITLENLNFIIQKILDWNDPHLYLFIVKGIKYAFFGMDELVVENFDGTYLSCDVPFRELLINKDESFHYIYDFGDKHNFCLTLLSETATGAYNKAAFLIAFKGSNISQYPLWIDGLPTFQFNYSTPANMLNKKIKYYSEKKWRVRFIQERDFDTLQKWRRSKDKRKWEKAVVILENDRLTIEELSEKIERSVDKIKSWINIFNAYGFKRLMAKKSRRTDKKNLRSEQSKLKSKRIIEILHQKPKSFGINRSNWNRESIATIYEEKYGDRIGISTVGGLINKAGYKMKKAKKVLTSPDPYYQEKVELLLRTLQSLKSNEMFFFIDELGPLRVKKYGGRCYIKKGNDYRVPKVQIHKGSITLSAALSATTNQLSWSFGKSKDTIAMIDLIEILYNQYQNYSKLFITWDAASWHSSNELNGWLDKFNKATRDIGEGPMIEFIPLPTSSQFLNVIESIFSGMKRAVVHHSDYRSPEEMKLAISTHFKERNDYFINNPKRAGKKIWEVDFFLNYNNIKSGDYRVW